MELVFREYLPWQELEMKLVNKKRVNSFTTVHNSPLACESSVYSRRSYPLQNH